MKSVAGKICSVEFLMEFTKIPNARHAGFWKKIMKGEYQLVFEFVNKVLLPQMEKGTLTSATDLFIMESLCKFETLDLFALMMEHMYKTVIKHKGKHGMICGTFRRRFFTI